MKLAQAFAARIGTDDTRDPTTVRRPHVQGAEAFVTSCELNYHFGIAVGVVTWLYYYEAWKEKRRNR